ncbi:hypothetical protein [Brevundimonas sp.]|uniref:hypothetical protein n=1 Tax=Brevundimonas sp. TaxID=1871086 RepID=UPI00286C4549|nr:hypothetical protein [Brevundimonas sp.]
MSLTRNLQAFGRFVLAAVALVSLLSSIWLGLHDRVPAGTLLAGLGLLLLAFVQLSRFKHIKGLGFEAELWESKQEEAAELITQTRALLKILSGAMLRSAPRMGRMMAGFDRREQLALASDVETALKAAGVPQSEFGNMRDEIDRLIAWDLAAPVTRAITKFVWARADEVRKEISQRFGSPIRDNEGFTAEHRKLQELNRSATDPNHLKDVPRSLWAESLRQHIEAIPLTDAASRAELARSQDEALKDLLAWTTDRTIRRPDVFFGPEPNE